MMPFFRIPPEFNTAFFANLLRPNFPTIYIAIFLFPALKILYCPVFFVANNTITYTRSEQIWVDASFFHIAIITSQ